MDNEMDREILLETDDSSLWIVKNFTKDHYDELQDLDYYANTDFMLYGKMCKQHRDIGFYSDVSEGYKYSSFNATSLKMNDILDEIMNHVNLKLETEFNGVLVNTYKDGNDWLSEHSDSKNGLSRNGIVAGICYGPGRRKFRIKDKKTKKIVLDYVHEPCTLLVMDGKFQEEFMHGIPKETKVEGERISLTFRRHTK